LGAKAQFSRLGAKQFQREGAEGTGSEHTPKK
jgi:hypothetical protein